MDTSSLRRNMLDKAHSPYLLSHKDNPVNWQEWSADLLEIARQNNKPLFISVGYSSCHWCHVMAREAFSNDEIAHFLNEHFICVKVDKEEHPDIDHYLMAFLQAQTGRGGWPLNAFLTPSLTPFAAMTYLPVKAKYGLRPFLDVGKDIIEFYKKNEEKIDAHPFTFSPTAGLSFSKVPLNKDHWDGYLAEILKGFDTEYGGLVGEQKFPPYTTLLYLLYFHFDDVEASKEVLTTLDVMAWSGLFDHAHGGFFRYCIDREWNIPHFEKLLSDQVMQMWVYVLSYKRYGIEKHENVLLSTLRFVNEEFYNSDIGLYFLSQNAESEGEEGKYYLWDEKEIEEYLTVTEHKKLADHYNLNPVKELGGKIHLRRTQKGDCALILHKLLDHRKKRIPPEIDKTHLTLTNALLGIVFVHVSRVLDDKESLTRASIIFESLYTFHFSGGSLAHKSVNNMKFNKEFIGDYASLLLLATYLVEHGLAQKEKLRQLRSLLLEFFDNGNWKFTKTDDFHSLDADCYDSPLPSPFALAELAMYRSNLQLGEEHQPLYINGKPLSSDFISLVSRFQTDDFLIIKAPKIPPFRHLPLLSIVVPHEEYSICYKGTCETFESDIPFRIRLKEIEAELGCLPRGEY